MDDRHEQILDMTNAHAAKVLAWMLRRSIGRGNGKSTLSLIYTTALIKAIAVLESTPDEESEVTT